MSAVLGEGYQVAADSAESVPLANHEVVTLVVSMGRERGKRGRERERESANCRKFTVLLTSLQGKLVGAGFEQDLPSIALVAHYDSFGLAPVSPMDEGVSMGRMELLEWQPFLPVLLLVLGSLHGRRQQWQWGGCIVGVGSAIFQVENPLLVCVPTRGSPCVCVCVCVRVCVCVHMCISAGYACLLVVG